MAYDNLIVIMQWYCWRWQRGNVTRSLKIRQITNLPPKKTFITRIPPILIFITNIPPIIK
jgi:hypothetical protein